MLPSPFIWFFMNFLGWLQLQLLGETFQLDVATPGFWFLDQFAEN